MYSEINVHIWPPQSEIGCIVGTKFYKFVFFFILQVYFGTFQSRNCLSANSVGINCSTGMSCLFRKDILEKSGGLAPLGKYLAEDYFISENIRKE